MAASNSESTRLAERNLAPGELLEAAGVGFDRPDAVTFLGQAEGRDHADQPGSHNRFPHGHQSRCENACNR